MWNFKRICALGMAAVLTLTSINLPARAEENETPKTTSQIQVGDYYKVAQTNGTLADTPKIKEGSTKVSKDINGKHVDSDSDNVAVSVNKTIKGTDEENVFEITLDVETNELIEKQAVSPDAAVVLVVDVSASMEYCLEHGVTDSCNNARIDAALEAAQKFINAYAASGKGQRKIAIAKFYKDGYIITGPDEGKTIDNAWVDASSLATADRSYNSVVANLADGVSSHSGTNIEAGALLARNLLTSDTVKDITNKTVILLSDGAANSSVVSSQEASSYAKNYGGKPEPTYNQKVTTYTAYEGLFGNADYHFHHGGAIDAVEEIKELGAAFESVYCGTASDVLTVHDPLSNDAYTDSNSGAKGCLQTGKDCKFCKAANAYWDSNKKTPDKKVTEFLGTISDKFVEAYNVEVLLNAFADLEKLIEIATQAWQGSDPMGITGEFVEITSGNTKNDEVDVNDNKISWYLLESKPTVTESKGKTTYTYSMTYKVKLDTLDESFTQGTYYPANAPTELKYYFTSGTETTDLQSIFFNVPSMKGFAGNYTFTKKDNEGKALSGATFTLTTSDDAEWSMSATSDENGEVTFSDIPSGHIYTLAETKAPSGYAVSNKTYTLEVSYGTVFVDDKKYNGENGIIVFNEPITTSLTGTKVWDDNNNSNGNRPESVTIKLYANGEDTGKTTTATSANNWVYSFTNLPKYKNGKEITYTVEEEKVPGYTTSVSGTTITNIEETIDITGEKVWNDNNNADGIRPESVTVYLKNGEETVATAKASSSTNWKYEFKNVPKYKNKEEIQYTVDEEAVEGYSTEVDGYTITNTHPEPATVTINGSKTLNGRDMKSDESFTFNIAAADEVTRNALTDGTITALNGTTSTVTGGKNGKANDFSFDKLTFNKAGTYTFNVTETAGTAGGVTYDSHTAVVTVNVTFNRAAGAFEATTSYNNGEGKTTEKAVFVNTYATAPATISLEVSKTLVGREWLDSDSFTFTLKQIGLASTVREATGDIVLPGNAGRISVTASNPTASFGDITFKSTGKYAFIVKEVVPENTNGITYDSNLERRVVIEVTDDGNGQLVASIVTAESESLSFTNTYDVDPTTISISGTKAMTGRDLGADEKYSFTIARVTENAPLPANTTVKNSADGKIDFGAILFAKAGEYVYTISESAENMPAGVTPDSKPVTVKIIVTENKTTGTLTAVAEYTKDGQPVENITFTNTYTIEKSAPVSINATKTVTGTKGNTYQMQGNDFSFAIKPASSNPNGDPVTETTVYNAAFGNIALITDAEYTQAGTYEYSVSENQGNIAGIIYDDSVYKITVVVTENTSTAKLETAVSFTKNGEEATAIAFNNTYTPVATTVGINGSKTMTGRALKANETFTFELDAADDITKQAIENAAIVDKDGNKLTSLPTATVTGDGSSTEKAFTFDGLKFKEAGTYKFTVSEQSGDAGKGVTYDSNVTTVTIVVTDENGQLQPVVTYENSVHADVVDKAAFVNSYSTNPTTATISGNKILTGRDWKVTDQFTFVLEAKTKDAPMPEEEEITITGEEVRSYLKLNGIENPENVPYMFSYSSITYTQTGAYEYILFESNVGEEDGAYNGIVYSEAQYLLTVNVSDDGEGNLVVDSISKVQIKDDAGEACNTALDKDELPVFTNKYEPSGTTTQGQIKVTKELEGREWLDSDSFSFKLEAITDGAPMPDEDTITITKGTAPDAAKEASFGTITYTQTGIYEYKVSEVVPEGATDVNGQKVYNGITYDSHETIVTVTVTEREALDGKLNIVASVTEEGSLTFKNTFTPSPANANISGTKILDGRKLEEGEFSFRLTAVDDAPMPGKAVVSNGANGEISFGSIVYTEEGTYEYTITEENVTLPGIEMDKGTVKVTVKVTKDAEGNLVPMVSYQKDEEAISETFTFTNTYTVEDTDPISITAVKSLTDAVGGALAMAAGDFQFAIVPATGNPTGDPVQRNVVTNDAAGNVTFASATYTQPGTYVYSVYEVPGSKAGVSYDSSNYTVTVNVTDVDASGSPLAKLSASVTITKAGQTVDAITFANTYDSTQTTASIYGQKMLNGGDKKVETGQFTFILSAADGTPMPAQTTVTNDGAGFFTFGTITYTEPGYYEYSVTEQATGQTGYSYDTSVYTVTVNVTQDADGALSAVVTGVVGGDGQAAITFNNSYVPAATSIGLGATKVLTGREQNAGEFEFTLLDHSGNVIAKSTNQEDGKVAFETLTFEKAGTYRYTIIETDTKVNGVSYDLSTTYDVEIQVTDKDGALEAVATYYHEGEAVDSSEVIFTNVYEPASTSVRLGGTKILEGRELKDGEFKFVLEDEDGNLRYAVNDAAGAILFDEITYEEAGTFVYKIYEEKGDFAGVTYDDTVFTMTVNVVDGLDGYLVASISEGSQKAVFKNTYTTTEDEEPSNPGGEDPSNPGGENPSNPDGTPDGGVDTGDTANTFLYLMLAIAALLTGGLTRGYRRKNK